MKIFCSSFVVNCLFLFIMNPAVYLNNKSFFRTERIGNKGTDAMLSPEFKA